MVRGAAIGALRFACFLLLAAARPIIAQEIDCDPGDTEVRKLTFAGNRTFSDSRLAAQIATTPSGTLYRYARFIGSRHCLDPVHLPLDSIRLLRFYQDRGFYDAAVDLDTTTVGDHAIAVHFGINEGQPMRIDTLTLTGLEGVPDSARIRRGLPIARGQRFDKEALGAALSFITTSLRNSGYPDADVFRGYDTYYDQHIASVQLTVVPGVRARIGDIRISVNGDVTESAQRIRDPVIRRLLGFHTGDVYNAQKLVDARRYLFQTGAYRHVEIGLAGDSVRPAGDSLVAVQIVLHEGPMRDVRVGLGWGTLDCIRVQGTATDRNFLGGARQLELTTRLSKIGIGYPLNGAKDICTSTVKKDFYSDTLNYRLSATLRQPGLFGLGPRNIPSLTGYSEQRSEYRAYFRSVPIGGVASLTRDLGPGLSLGFAYQLEYGRTEAQPAIYCALFNLCGAAERARVREKQPLAVASISFAREHTPSAESDGSSIRIDLRHASKTILSDPTLQFNTLIGDARRYWNVGGGVEIAARFYGGAVVGNRISFSGGPDDLVRNVSEYVPPQERLYAGGPNSVRGFRFNELGPVVYVVDRFSTVTAPNGEVYYRADSTRDGDWRAVPTGGNTLMVANLEARLPSPFLNDLLRYAVFVDAGRVWNRDRTSTVAGGLRQLRVTPGAGIRVASPVGPIRVDVGYNPYNRPPGVAYNAFRGADDRRLAPLYCVSPDNTRPIVPGELPGDPPIQREVVNGQSRPCSPTFVPSQPTTWLKRLTFNFSIGPAF
jgi:outer membrane protein insertion porin family/translocation and assembly module TamA